MDTLRVIHSNRNLEVVAKIMNSYATKYDCNIKYNVKHNSLDFKGDHSYKHTIAYETSGVVNVTY